MKSILLIGVGRFGRRIAHRLSEMNVEIMAVDKKEERVEMAAPFADRVLVGDASNADFLKGLGVRNFDTCIVAIGDDFLSSLEVTSLLKELGARRVISRAARDTQEKFLLRNGADEVVYPEKQMANWLSLHVAPTTCLTTWNLRTVTGFMSSWCLRNGSDIRSGTWISGTGIS